MSDGWRNPALFCADLPTRPDPSIGTVLVTGASGYIGGRLVPELMARGYVVRVMVRAQSAEYEERWPGAEIVVADALDPHSLEAALHGTDIAYYLIHSMLLGPSEFAEADIRAASNFRRVAEDKGVGRIIYLGGLGDKRTHLSTHLRSRMEVAEELIRGRVPVTVLRAAIIIGSGSASYEIIKNLVENLPLIVAPLAVRNKCQPVAIRDVVKYLVGVMETAATSGKAFDICGPETLTYEEMMRTVADLLEKRPLFVRLPLLSISVYAYVASLLTPVPAPITRCLLEGLRNDVVCQDQLIKTFLPFEPLSYREAVSRALARESQDRVRTRWSDAYPPSHELAPRLDQVLEVSSPEAGEVFTASYEILTTKEPASVFRSVCAIGGREGWFHRNWMWRLRGLLDRAMLGVGSARGRRHHGGLKINDVVGFWRVEDLKENRRLLLRAEMKLPGMAWLEFGIDEPGGWNRLVVTAYYKPAGVLGKAYWYATLPFHRSIFKGLIEQIERRS